MRSLFDYGMIPKIAVVSRFDCGAASMAVRAGGAGGSFEGDLAAADDLRPKLRLRREACGEFLARPLRPQQSHRGESFAEGGIAGRGDQSLSQFRDDGA